MDIVVPDTFSTSNLHQPSLAEGINLAQAELRFLAQLQHSKMEEENEAFKKLHQHLSYEKQLYYTHSGRTVVRGSSGWAWWRPRGTKPAEPSAPRTAPCISRHERLGPKKTREPEERAMTEGHHTMLIELVLVNLLVLRRHSDSRDGWLISL